MPHSFLRKRLGRVARIKLIWPQNFLLVLASVGIFICSTGFFYLILRTIKKHKGNFTVNTKDIITPIFPTQDCFVSRRNGFTKEPQVTNGLLHSALHELVVSKTETSANTTIDPYNPEHWRGPRNPSQMELMGNAITFATIADILFILRMINCIFIVKIVRMEDYLMMLTMVPYATLLVLINVSAKHDTNLFPMGMRDKIMSNPAEVAARIWGSKLVVVLEHMMLLTTWGVKACFLLFIARITERIPRYKRWLRVLTLYIIIGFLALVIVFYFGACRPFKQYWEVPVQNLQCSTYAIYSIVQVCLNITSDFGLILMPMIIVSRMQLTLARKITLLLPFSVGFFTVLAALLSA